MEPKNGLARIKKVAKKKFILARNENIRSKNNFIFKLWLCILVLQEIASICFVYWFTLFSLISNVCCILISAKLPEIKPLCSSWI